jgi:hypothetical protein
MKKTIITTIAILAAVGSAFATNQESAEALKAETVQEERIAEGLNDALFEQANTVANKKVNRFLDLQNTYNAYRIEEKFEGNGAFNTGPLDYFAVVNESAE